MRNLKYLCVLAFLMMPAPGAAPAADLPPQPAKFAEADKAFLERADRERAVHALELYRQIFKQNPLDADAAWRLSMACYFVGFNVLKKDADRVKLFAEGRDAGQVAVRLAPREASSHFWTAVNMALYGQTVGVVKMLFTLNTVRDHLRKSAAIDPAYAYGGACRILGKIDESLPGILGGSRERALTYYRQAIACAPDEPLNYLFLAKLLAQSGLRAEARDMVRRGLGVSKPEAFRFESIDALKELETLAGTLSPE